MRFIVPSCMEDLVVPPKSVCDCSACDATTLPPAQTRMFRGAFGAPPAPRQRAGRLPLWLRQAWAALCGCAAGLRRGVADAWRSLLRGVRQPKAHHT